MNNFPIVSVVMPVYNAERFVAQAVESILGQTFSDFEFIIIDDGSTDYTPTIIAKYKDPRIKVIRKERNEGIVSALNLGIALARGDYIARMDADDISLPHRLEVQMKLIEKDPSIILLGGWCKEIDENGKIIKTHRYPESHEKLVNNLINIKKFPPHPSMIFRKDLVLKVKGYRERFRHAEDADLWLRLVDHGKFACVPEVVLLLRKHKMNVSYQFSHFQTLNSVAARICYITRKKGLPDPSEMNDKEWGLFLKWLENELNKKNYFSFRKKMTELKYLLYSKKFLKELFNSSFLIPKILLYKLGIYDPLRELYKKDIN